MKKYSVKQQLIYEYIVEHLSRFGYPPTVREIGLAVGLRSPSTVHFHLRALESAGLIIKDAGKTRAITVNSLSDERWDEEPGKDSVQNGVSDFSADSKDTPEDQKEAEELQNGTLSKAYDFKRKAAHIPILGQVAAGAPILAQELLEDYLSFDMPGQLEEYFALRVRGDSMINAGILPDDLLVVRKQQTARHGEIVIALIEDEATVKRLSRRDGQIWLMPENDEYEPIDGSQAEILGKVTAVVRRY